MDTLMALYQRPVFIAYFTMLEIVVILLFVYTYGHGRRVASLIQSILTWTTFTPIRYVMQPVHAHHVPQR